MTAVVALAVGAGVGVAATPEDDPERDTLTARNRDEGDEDEDDEAAADDEPTTTDAPRRSTTTRPPRTTTTRAAEVGTRENPFGLGVLLETDDGLGVVVHAVNFEAAEVIAAANTFNEPAPPGMRYALIDLTITNNTEENVHSGFALSLGMVGSANRAYDAANANCGVVIPTPLYDGGELFPGGSFRGNECRLVPEAEVADGSLLVTVAANFGDPVFVRTA